MRRLLPPSLRRSSRLAGFTMVECAVAMLLTSVLMVISLGALAASKRREAATVDQLRAEQIACDLMNEILNQAYQEPGGTVLFGPETGETGGTRAAFDDVDDYAGWTSTPPNDRSGTAIPGFTGWTRRVTVEWADPTTLAVSPGKNTGLKRITVTVLRQSKTMATVVAYRSVAWVDTIPTPTDATGNHPPTAIVWGSNLTGWRSTTANFYASFSSDSDGDSLTYVWNYGDGTSGTGASVSHLYNTVGTFTCTLTAYDGRGGVGTATVNVTVTP